MRSVSDSHGPVNARCSGCRESGPGGVHRGVCGIFPNVNQEFSSPVAAPCPCCGGSGTHFLEAIPYREIWTRLATEWQARFSAEVVRRNTPCDRTSLLECEECGLQFFHPPLAGDEDFYRELGESPLYYAPWKWEFGWVKDRIRRGTAVLDVGCGQGDFLLGISELAGRITGVERNPLAAREAGARGVEVASSGIEKFAERHGGAFDAACAFHVVEHLPEPVPFLRTVLRCLRPGGELFLSLPNRERSARGAREPLDCPPHHLTRWSPDPFRRLSGLLDIRLLEVAFEPVEFSIPREVFREKVRRGLSSLPVAGKALGSASSRLLWRVVLNDPLSLLLRRLGVFERMGYRGNAMVGRFAVERV